MDESIKPIMDATEESMNKAIEHLESELLSIRAGKATPIMLDGIKVDYYGSPTLISQVAAVNVGDARTLVIKPWEKNMIPSIEKAINEANLGFNPQNDGDIIRIPIPRLTEERRKDLVKQAKAEGENTKISIRNARQDANQELKQLQKDGVSEDLVKSAEKDIQDMTSTFTKQVDQIISTKEEEIMTV